MGAPGKERSSEQLLGESVRLISTQTVGRCVLRGNQFKSACKLQTAKFKFDVCIRKSMFDHQKGIEAQRNREV